MKIAIAPEIIEKYPDARVGWMMADVKVLPTHPHSEELKAGLAASLAARGIDEDNLAKHPDIARWRDVYSDMGVKPSKFKSAPEALARRVAKGQEMWTISSPVDCYDAVSVMTLLSMGAHDASKIAGTMTLRYCREGDEFLPLGREGEVIPTTTRQIAYIDDEKICCWLWNHKDTHLASVTEATTEAVFIVDAAFTPQTTSIADGLDILAEHLVKIGCTPKERGIVGG